ncbi:helix-turn-helix transcriptional regulator [Mycolicibacterium peregrinum]|uniref:helix-turn-helix transcriptional regulator n=1 Tax=Mycolicibacterium peregrinum TaxID=43304 RepID=UPI003AAF31EF
MDVPLVRNRITQLEDLRNAVKDAGLSAFQMSREPPRGSLIHAADGGVAFSSGRFDSRVQIRGPLSADGISIAVGLRIPPRNRLLMREIDSGVVTMFRPGDEHEAFHDVNALYAVVTLSEETLESEAERHGLRLSPKAFRRTGIHPQLLAPTHLTSISACLARVHGDDQADLGSAALADIVAAFIGHFARLPAPLPDFTPRQRQRIVESTRSHIDQNLDKRLDIEGLARLAKVSRRTLARAFEETLGESPQSYIARMRLHRIRADLLACGQHVTVAEVSNRWGISELGRMAARYRDLFGESPSQTRSRCSH